MAAYSGDLESLAQESGNGASIDAFSPRGSTPLIYALENHQQRAAEWLLAHGANPSHPSRTGFTPLSYAFWAGVDKRGGPEAFDERWLRLLLERGADPLAAPKYRDPLLFLVASEYPPQAKALRFVLSHHLPVDQRSGKDCWTALSRVVAMESFYPKEKNEVVGLLLAAGADPNVSWATNSYVESKRSYPTPLIRAAQGLVREMEQPAASVAGWEARLKLINALLDAGADPRFGGFGSQVSLPAQCVEVPEGEPGSSSSGGSSWGDFSNERSNPALTEIIGDASSFRPAFDRLVDAASPIASGEIGYPAFEAVLSRYSNLLAQTHWVEDDLAKNDPRAAQQYTMLRERVADLEYALTRLLDLRARVNPEQVQLSEENTWNDLWTAMDGISSLPLFEHRMPDALYEAFLAAGANPALRKGGFFGDHSSLITHLILKKAASKLELLRKHPGLLTHIPLWCGRSVADIGKALGQQGRDSLTTPTGQVARHFLLDLLSQPGCHVRTEDERQQVTASLRKLGDSEITRALSQSAFGAMGERVPEAHR